MKKCTACGVTQPLTEFHKHTQTKDGFTYKCKSCVREYFKKYYATNGRKRESKDAIRNQHLKRQFNITLEQYNQILAEQEFSCAICKKHQNECKKSLAVDHAHSCCPGTRSCGQCVRGLLCFACNTDVGRIEGGRLPLQSLLQYVEKFAQ